MPNLLDDELISLIAEAELRKKYNKQKTIFPDTGPYRRELYSKHMSFIKAGAKHRERCFIAGNRTGKTLTGADEMAYHLTGDYPDWWEGKRFKEPINAWACGKDGKTVRDIVQFELLGSKTDMGSGMIPKDCIVRTTSKPGVPDAIETVEVKHISGGTSLLTFKSYDAGVDSFVGTAVHVIWLDEEPPANVYSECLIRTATTKGIIYITFTPIHGLSEVVLKFLPGGQIPEDGRVGNAFVIMVDWDSVPHLDEETKKELLASLPPHERDARSKGIPALGSGAVYPVPEDDFLVDPFEIPKHWPRGYGLDVGWNRTAAVFFAWNRDTDTVYIYDEYYKGQAEPAIHASAIKMRGEWLNGVIDPASRGRSQSDGKQLYDIYLKEGLRIYPSKNDVEAGIYEVWQRLSTGRLKVLKTCQNWIAEKRLYRRDDKGKVVKENDHLMDATKYAILSGLRVASYEPVYEEPEDYFVKKEVDEITGY